MKVMKRSLATYTVVLGSALYLSGATPSVETAPGAARLAADASAITVGPIDQQPSPAHWRRARTAS